MYGAHLEQQNEVHILYQMRVGYFTSGCSRFSSNEGNCRRCVELVYSEKVFLDEVSKYDSLQVNYLREARMQFLEDDFEVMRYRPKENHSSLCYSHCCASICYSCTIVVISGLSPLS